jgi:hypothetical protein
MQRIQSDPQELRIPPSAGGLARLVIVAVVATAIDIAAFYMLARMELSQTARLAVALLPVPADTTLLVMILRRIQRLDEFQKRLQFEAVVIAFLSTALAVFFYGYLQKAQAVGPLSVGLVWAFMAAFYAIGRVVAAGHYK